MSTRRTTKATSTAPRKLLLVLALAALLGAALAALTRAAVPAAEALAPAAGTLPPDGIAAGGAR